MSNALEILQQPAVVARMTAAILPIVRDKDRADIQVAAERQGFYRALQLIKPEDLALVPTSEIERVAISSVATGLSWAEEEGNFYLQPRNQKVIKTDSEGNRREVTEKRLELSLTHRGETSLRRMQGMLKFIDGPHVIREGDVVKNLNKAKNTLDHESKFPVDVNAKVIGVYEFIVLPDGQRLLRLFDESDFASWASYSAKQNGNYGANKLYTSGPSGGIDIGFAKGKCIKHGFKGLPKCKTFGLQIEPDEERDEPLPQTVWTEHEEVHQDTPATESIEPTILPNSEDESF